jgi:hypothetical protein
MNITDALQIALSYDGLFGALTCTSLCYLIYWSLKLLGITIQFLEVSVKFLFGKDRHGFLKRFGVMLLLGYTVSFFRAEISDFVQRFETPIYSGQYDGLSSDNISEAFERRIMDLNPAYISNEVIKRTRLLAAELQIPAHYIYQTALSECSLKPLTIRRDGIAAGWIQFTTIGLSGITSESLADVKQYCKNGQISQIMDLTDKYVRYHTKGKKIERAVDFYLVVFSPANLGRGNDAVLYEGANNPAYYLNGIFDGYTQKADGRIVRSRKNIDYRITVGELALCIEAKKNALIYSVNR